MDYKLAYSYAKSYCNEKNVELLNKYVKHFKNSGVNIGNLDNFKNCFLFAGALYDSLNDKLPEWKLEQRKIDADNLAKKIDFANYDNLEVIEKNLEYFCATFKRIDAKNSEQYQNVYNAAAAILNNFYKKEKTNAIEKTL